MWFRILAPLLKKGEPAAQPKPSSRALTKQVLNTLKDESNPVTHSDLYLRSGTFYRVSEHTVHLRAETPSTRYGMISY